MSGFCLRKKLKTRSVFALETKNPRQKPFVLDKILTVDRDLSVFVLEEMKAKTNLMVTLRKK